MRRQFSLAQIIAINALPVAIVIFITLQGIAASFFFHDWLSIKLTILSLICIAFYYIGFFLSFNISQEREPRSARPYKILFFFLIFIYLFSYLLLYINAGGIPLIQHFLTNENTSELRANLYKNLDFPWIILAYVTSILGKGFIPFALITLKTNYNKNIYTPILFLLIFISISAFEKIHLAWLFIPLSIYYIHTKEFKKFLRTLIIFIFLLTGISWVSLSSELASAPSQQVVTTENPPSISKVNLLYTEQTTNLTNASLPEEDNYQFLLSSRNPNSSAFYIFNRLLWIPFITAYDTLLYWDQNYDSFILFGVNRHLSKIFNIEFANLEKNVFMFQFKSGEETTGNSNSFFIAESYAGFGIIGVVVFSLFTGLIFGFFIKTNIISVVCAAPMIALGLISVSLISTLFSGGLGLFIISIFIFCIKKQARKDERKQKCLPQ